MPPSTNHKQYFPYLCGLLTVKDGAEPAYNHRTMALPTRERLREITPDDVVRYLYLKCYGTTDPGPDDRPTFWRVDTAQFAKKAISSYMADYHAWNHDTKSGNPTKSKDVHAVIKRLKQFQVRKQGRPSRTKRDMKFDEIKVILDILDRHRSFDVGRWADCMRLQITLIGRGDDICHLKCAGLRRHGEFQFALETEVNWSKNVLDERDCPPQILLGAVNASFCVILSLALYMETRFGLHGLDFTYIFATGHDENAPKRATNNYYKSVKKWAFVHPRVLQIQTRISGGIGVHSVRKFASTYCKRLGRTQEEIDCRARWKRQKSSRISSRYISPEQPTIDARCCETLCIDGAIRYTAREGSGVTNEFLAVHVCPAIKAFYSATEDGGAGLVEVLGYPILWACHEVCLRHRVPDTIWNRVRQAYEDIRPEGFEDNPIQRIRIHTFRVGEALVIQDRSVIGEEEDEAPPGPGGATGPHGIAMRAEETHTMQEATDRLTAQMHAISQRMDRLNDQLSLVHADLKQQTSNLIGMTNSNLAKCFVLPPRQHNPNGTAVPRPAHLVVRLSSRPRDLHCLWAEYIHGSGGMKAAKDFTSVERGQVKQKYYRRKVFWDVVSALVRAGYSSANAVRRVYQTYGPQESVTNILTRMLRDRKEYGGHPHPNLRV